MSTSFVGRAYCVFWCCYALATTHALANFEPPREAEEIEKWALVISPHLVKAVGLEKASRAIRTATQAVAPNVELAGIGHRGELRIQNTKSASKSQAAIEIESIRKIPGVIGIRPIPSNAAIEKARIRRHIASGGARDVLGFILKFREGEKASFVLSDAQLSVAALSRIERAAGLTISNSRPMSGDAHVVDLAAPVDRIEGWYAVQRLLQDPSIEYADVNGVSEAKLLPNDTFFSSQWSLTRPGSGINAPAAWDITTGSAQVPIAVVDSGILPHPELAGRLRQGYDFVSNSLSAGDGDGRDSDPTDPGNWRPAGYCFAGSGARSSSWHGLHVTGIIGANGSNASGIAGINWQSPIVPVRALGKCGGTDADILDGLRWAAGLPVPGVPNNLTPARIINMSLGGPGNCQTDRTSFLEAVIDAYLNHAIIVVAAGNDNESALTNVPASCIGVITVAATGPTGDKAAYSNFSTAIEIAAPGGDSSFGNAWQIPSTVASGTQSDIGSPTYGYLEGTSQAAPHVSGVASLMLSVRPGLTTPQVRDGMRLTATAFPAGSSCAALRDCGSGIVNAGAAVSFAQQLVNPLNTSSLWWNSSESGWGVNFQQQGNIIFGTWFTYASNGQGLWLVMPSLARVTEDIFSGDIYQTTGTPFNLISGAPALGQVQKVGEAIILFFGVDEAMFLYEIGGVVGGKDVRRQRFGNLPSCTFTASARTGLTNYQDLWWNPAESGWGINLTHQGDTIFATWFTYGSSGQGVWFVGPDVRRIGNNQYRGRLYQTTGTPFNLIAGSQALASVTDVGELTLTFTNGEQGRMDYLALGNTGSKLIQRQVFSSPTSACTTR